MIAMRGFGGKGALTAIFVPKNLVKLNPAVRGIFLKQPGFLHSVSLHDRRIPSRLRQEKHPRAMLATAPADANHRKRPHAAPTRRRWPMREA